MLETENKLQSIEPKYLYYHILKGNGSNAEPLPEQLEDLDKLDPPNSAEELLGIIYQWNSSNSNKDQSPIEKTEVLLHYSPTAFLAGCWLESCVSIMNSYSDLGEAMIDAYFLEIGRGDVSFHRGNLYKSLLASYGIQLPNLTNWNFINDSRFTNSDFELALMNLSIGKRGVDYLPEVLGIHLVNGILGYPNVVKSALEGNFLLSEQYNLPRTEAAKKCLLEYSKTPNANWNRIWYGVKLTIHCWRKWEQSLSQPKTIPSAWEEMVKLIESKIPYSYGFHKNLKTENGTLDDWMSPNHFEPISFLQKIASSKWVVPGKPEKSLLVKQSEKFGGQMFGVFTQQEISIIYKWISILEKEPNPPERSSSSTNQKQIIPHYQPSNHSHSKTSIHLKSTAPELFYQLLNKNSYPQSIGRAKSYVDYFIEKSKKYTIVQKLKKQKLIPYSNHCLKDWIDTQLKEQVLGKNILSPTTIANALTKEDVLWILAQVSPSAFVDGGWLQGLSSPSISYTPLAIQLFEIYRDELGSGILKQHHGYIMRKILEDSGVHLPPCNSKEFINSSRVIPQAFYLPTLWLSIAENSNQFQPELLGLNLAVEIAGIGNGYNMMIEILKHHKIDPYFFCLHNTIDNAVTGHTAMAAKAIQYYMENAIANSSPKEVEELWSRVWSGFYIYGLASKYLVIETGKKLGLKILRKLVF